MLYLGDREGYGSTTYIMAAIHPVAVIFVPSYLVNDFVLLLSLELFCLVISITVVLDCHNNF